MSHPHMMAAMRSIDRYTDDEQRIAFLLKYTTKERGEAERLLSAAKEEYALRRTRAVGFVRSFVDGMKQFGFFAVIAQVLLGLGFLGIGVWFLLNQAEPIWLLIGTFMVLGISALVFAKLHWDHIHTKDVPELFRA